MKHLPQSHPLIAIAIGMAMFGALTWLTHFQARDPTLNPQGDALHWSSLLYDFFNPLAMTVPFVVAGLLTRTAVVSTGATCGFLSFLVVFLGWSWIDGFANNTAAVNVTFMLLLFEHALFGAVGALAGSAIRARCVAV